MTARDILEPARDYHPGFRSNKIPDASAFRQLVRIMKVLMARISVDTPGIVSEDGVITAARVQAALDAPVSSNPHRRIDIPAYIQPVPPMFIQTEAGEHETEEVNIAPLALQYRVDQSTDRLLIEFPSLAMAEKRVELTDLRRFGGDRHGWEDLNGDILYHYVPVPHSETPLTKLGQELQVPEGLSEALIMKMAAWMANRAGLLNEALAYEDRYTNEASLALNIIQQGAVIPGSWQAGG